MNFHGLQSTPARQAGLLQRLFGRPVKENAVIEITNLLAEGEIQSTSLPAVADILKRHDLGFGECREQFLGVFRTVLAHSAKDRELSGPDMGNLAHLQMILNLSDEDVRRVREEVLAALFANSLADALSDGHITAEERARLDRTKPAPRTSTTNR